jgi:hypothetical protein
LLFRRLLQRTPFYGTYKALGHYPDYWYWRLRGRPARTPHLLKQRTVVAYARRYGLRVLVETGTYHGEMVAAMARRFDGIFSIECDPDLARRAARRFARQGHVRIIEGDSRRAIPQLLQTLDTPALFWLDAGYYGWAGRVGETERLSDELLAILRHPVNEHVVLMDDAHGLDGRNGGLTVAALEARLRAEFPGRSLEVRYDIVRITPAL